MRYLIVILGTLLTWLSVATITLSAEPSPLSEVLRQTRFITYTPRDFSLVNDKVTPPSVAGIQDDLQLLSPYFNGLITYAADKGQERIPAISRGFGFQAIMMGIWDPRSEVEIGNVIKAAKRYPKLINAVIVGNEGIYTKRYLPADVQQAMARIKHECPTLAVTTSEPFFLYFKKEYADFFKSHDLLLPIVHPVFEPWFNPEEPTHGVEMVLNVANKFKESYDKPILIKETGLPSGPQGASKFSPERQAIFWAELLKRFPTSSTLALSCFEAFDAPWKPGAIAKEFPGDHASEAFWGFFTKTGEAKKVVSALTRLPQ